MARPRGFQPWSPRGASKELLAVVRSILDDYREEGILPITLRQLFYRLVAWHDYDKTERAYNRLQEMMNRARRAHAVDMKDLRDDTFHMRDAWWFDDKADFYDYVQRLASGYTVDRQAGQATRLLVWCEAAGMVPQLERTANRYGVPVASCGGFDKLLPKHDIGRRLAREPTIVLHIGDYDPSGVHMFGALDEDVRTFCEQYGGETELIRLAVLSEHIEQYRLPTAPPKSTDKRSFDDTRTVQCEALDPSDLAAILRQAIESHMDMDLFRAQLTREEQEKSELLGESRAMTLE